MCNKINLGMLSGTQETSRGKAIRVALFLLLDSLTPSAVF